MNFRAAHRRGEDFGIDLMPLVDVVFLLLIFFLITTSFARPDEANIPVNLPEGVSGSEAGQGERVVLLVTADGEVQFQGGGELAGDTLEERLASLKESRPEADILLKGDTEASHGRVVETLDAIKAAGFDQVNLVIKKQGR